jgi:hypothetical protein
VVTIEVDFDRSQKTSRDPLEEINVAIGEGGSKSEAGKEPPTKENAKIPIEYPSRVAKSIPIYN